MISALRNPYTLLVLIVKESIRSAIDCFEQIRYKPPYIPELLCRHKGSDTSVYALLYKLITHLALRQSRHKPPHCKIINAITIIPPTTPHNPISLYPTTVNTHRPQNSPIMSAYRLRPYMAMMFRNILLDEPGSARLHNRESEGARPPTPGGSTVLPPNQRPSTLGGISTTTPRGCRARQCRVRAWFSPLLR